MSLITDYDLYLFGEGNHTHAYDKLGAHPLTEGGVEGVHFAVWAPNAQRVSIVGDFNAWYGREHPMRMLHTSGVWAAFVPGARRGQRVGSPRLGSRVPLPAVSCRRRGRTSGVWRGLSRRRCGC